MVRGQRCLCPRDGAPELRAVACPEPAAHGARQGLGVTDSSPRSCTVTADQLKAGWGGQHRNPLRLPKAGPGVPGLCPAGHPPAGGPAVPLRRPLGVGSWDRGCHRPFRQACVGRQTPSAHVPRGGRTGTCPQAACSRQGLLALPPPTPDDQTGHFMENRRKGRTLSRAGLQGNVELRARRRGWGGPFARPCLCTDYILHNTSAEGIFKAFERKRIV